MKTQFQIDSDITQPQIYLLPSDVQEGVPPVITVTYRYGYTLNYRFSHVDANTGYYYYVLIVGGAIPKKKKVIPPVPPPPCPTICIVGNVGDEPTPPCTGTRQELNQVVQLNPYSNQLQASGGTAPYTYIVSVGSLPTGLTLNPATGEISGIPTVVGNFDFTIQATDSNGCIGTQDFTIAVKPIP